MEERSTGDSRSSDALVRCTLRKLPKVGELNGLPLSAFLSPGKWPERGVTRIVRSPFRCAKCKAFLCSSSAINFEEASWKCALCSTVNRDAELKAQSAEYMPELTEDVVEYTEDSTEASNACAHAVQLAAAEGSRTVILCLDELILAKTLRGLQGTLEKLLQSLPPSTNIGVMLLGRSVGVVSLEDGEASTTHRVETFPGSMEPHATSIWKRLKGGLYIRPLHECYKKLMLIISSLRPSYISRRQQRRCVGLASAIAMVLCRGPKAFSRPQELLKDMDSVAATRLTGAVQVMNVLSGPANFGVGSLEGLNPLDAKIGVVDWQEQTKAASFLTNLGKTGRHMGVQMDFFCGGGVVFAASHLQKLVSETGGRVYICQDFGDQCLHTMKRSFEETKLSGSYSFVDTFHSKELSLVGIEGPVAPPKGSEQASMKGSGRMVVLCSGDESRGVMFTYTVDSPISSDHVYLQFSVSFLDESSRRVTRVINTTLETATDTKAVVASADGEAVALAIGRRAVLAVTKGGTTQQAIMDVMESTRQIAESYGSQAWVFGARQLHGLPQSLSRSPFLSSLFFLCRGPLLGKVWQHEDDISVVRYAFLHGDFSCAVRMMKPRLFIAFTTADGGVKVDNVFPEDTLLHPQVALLLDIHTHVFIWHGAQVDPEKDAVVHALTKVAECLTSARGESGWTWLDQAMHGSDGGVKFDRHLVRELEEEGRQWPVIGRLPAPYLYVFKEGSSMARWLESLLDPSHKDGAGTMAWVKGAVGALRNVFAQSGPRSFPRTDQLSFKQWAHEAGVDGGGVERASHWTDDTSL
mmetsp:Transcript_8539/g.22828  ORF Transcript_8539/g.22828 Transcript_8539/m.22828 type:complete len:808 (-) Transcript_8539:1374-3797(-)